MTRHLVPFTTFSGLLLAWAATTAPAWACPSPYSGYACEGLATYDICGYESSAVWMCDVTVNGDTAGATITVVGGYDAGYDYSAWGTDAAGNLFCCSVASTSLTTVAVQGGTYNDTINFTYTSGATTWDLYNRSHSSRLTGFASGGPGEDAINGSKNAGGYLDSLHGDGGDDTINGNLGVDEITGDDDDDLIYGGGSADMIHGNDGGDTIYGEGGTDTITGDNGDDYIDGGGDADFITGGKGGDILIGSASTDTLVGNDGNDVLCGGASTDNLCGGADDDQLWGDAGTDSAMGMGGTDACSAETTQTCESTLSTKPAVCP